MTQRGKGPFALGFGVAFGAALGLVLWLVTGHSWAGVLGLLSGLGLAVWLGRAAASLPPEGPST